MGKVGLLHHSNPWTAAVARFPPSSKDLAFQESGVRVSADASRITAPLVAAQ
jgi:hypothetical protein